MKKALVLAPLFFLISTLFSNAQQETYHWYFGPGLDFNTDPPTIDNTGRFYSGEGTSSISDANGQLLFYTTQANTLDTISNKLQQVMANGAGINGNPTSTQSSLIVKKPGSTNIYYLFSECGLFGNAGSAGGLRYSEIDMSLASGNGSVTAKNMPVYLNAMWGQSEKLSAVKHCNGVDIWIMTYDIEAGNHFRCFLVTAAGVNTTAVVSQIGLSQANIIGQGKFSPNGRRIGFASPAQLFDFDASSGIVTNSISLNTSGYGCEFSPDGTKFYVSSSAQNQAVIYQWDLCAGSSNAIVNSSLTIGSAPNVNFGSIQNAANGKTYVATLPTSYLSIINNPNNSGAACNFLFQGQSLGTRICQWSLPNFVVNNFKQLPAPFTYTIGACTDVQFTQPPISTLTPLCSAAALPYSTTSWDFGDPNSGAQNTSSLNACTHVFSASGIYEVKLILNGPCGADTLRKKIDVLSNALTANTNSSSICAGNSSTLVVNGATSYSWTTGSNTNSTIVQPLITTTYVVTGTIAPGCSITKQMVVNVSKCTGIDELNQNENIRLYPNPFNAELIIESSQEGELILLDAIGQVMQRSHLRKGQQTIDTGTLRAGFYVARILNKNNKKDFRLIKVN